MRTVLVALTAVFLVGGIASQATALQDESNKKSAGFDPKRDAAKDIESAVKVATKQNKRILLDVGGEW